MLYCIRIYYIVLYYVTLYHIISSYDIVFYIILYHIILYYIILYIILYYIILYYIISYFNIYSIFFGTPNHPWSIPRPQGALDALDFGREVRQVWPLYWALWGTVKPRI